MTAILGINPVLLAITCAAIAGCAWMLFDEWVATRPTPPNPVDDWDNWDWDDDGDD